MSKLIYEAKNLGIVIDQKMLKIDLKSEKRYRDIIDENFQKPNEQSKVNSDDDPSSIYGDDGGGNHENSLRESKKPAEILQIEEEYNSLMKNSIVLRRGRCGRYFTKYIQKSIFEESEGNSDGEEEAINNEKKSIKKRRKRY